MKLTTVCCAANAYSASYVDPYAALRSKTITSTDPEERACPARDLLIACSAVALLVTLLCAAVARQMQEQQLKARQLVLQQQAASATAAASKTQREVCGPAYDHAVPCTPDMVFISSIPCMKQQGGSQSQAAVCACAQVPCHCVQVSVC